MWERSCFLGGICQAALTPPPNKAFMDGFDEPEGSKGRAAWNLMSNSTSLPKSWFICGAPARRLACVGLRLWLSEHSSVYTMCGFLHFSAVCPPLPGDVMACLLMGSLMLILSAPRGGWGLSTICSCSATLPVKL